MQDAVAEVLRERETLSQSAVTGVALSLLLHTALVFGFYVHSRTAPRQELNRPVIVRIASASSAQRTLSPGAPGVRAATPEPVQKPAPPAPPQQEDLPTSPAAEKATVKESPFGRRPEKGKLDTGKQSARPFPTPQTEERTTPVTPGTGSEGAFGVPAIGTAGVTGLEGGDFPYTVYIERMLALIGRQWFRPETRGEPLAQVYFRIERDGRVRDVRVEKPSGDPTFDRAAHRAILEASPLPPLPFGYRGQYLGVHLSFH
ncbi:MAG TPA: TonB family protein [Thermoanaerobaculia bacterium]|nr:TonB family protein [Thermoanaerobaculia bacterium]